MGQPEGPSGAQTVKYPRLHWISKIVSPTTSAITERSPRLHVWVEWEVAKCMRFSSVLIQSSGLYIHDGETYSSFLGRMVRNPHRSLEKPRFSRDNVSSVSSSANEEAQTKERQMKESNLIVVVMRAGSSGYGCNPILIAWVCSAHPGPSNKKIWKSALSNRQNDKDGEWKYGKIELWYPSVGDGRCCWRP